MRFAIALAITFALGFAAPVTAFADSHETKSAEEGQPEEAKSAEEGPPEVSAPADQPTEGEKAPAEGEEKPAESEAEKGEGEPD